MAPELGTGIGTDRTRLQIGPLGKEFSGQGAERHSAAPHFSLGCVPKPWPRTAPVSRADARTCLPT